MSTISDMQENLKQGASFISKTLVEMSERRFRGKPRIADLLPFTRALMLCSRVEDEELTRDVRAWIRHNRELISSEYPLEQDWIAVREQRIIPAGPARCGSQGVSRPLTDVRFTYAGRTNPIGIAGSAITGSPPNTPSGWLMASSGCKQITTIRSGSRSSSGRSGAVACSGLRSGPRPKPAAVLVKSGQATPHRQGGTTRSTR